MRATTRDSCQDSLAGHACSEEIGWTPIRLRRWLRVKRIRGGATCRISRLRTGRLALVANRSSN